MAEEGGDGFQERGDALIQRDGSGAAKSRSVKCVRESRVWSLLRRMYLLVQIMNHHVQDRRPGTSNSSTWPRSPKK